MGQEVQDLFLASYFLGCFILRAAKIKSQPVNICQQTAKGITYFTCLVVTVIPKTFCKMKSLSFLFLLSFLIPVSASAQKPAVTAYAPTREEIARRYKRANELDTLARRSVFKTNVTPNWSGASSFWYRNILADSIPEYMFVDPVKNTKHVLFDPVKLAAALTEATKKTVDQRKLALKDIYVYPGANKIAIATGIVFMMLILPLTNFQKLIHYRLMQRLIQHYHAPRAAGSAGALKGFRPIKNGRLPLKTIIFLSHPQKVAMALLIQRMARKPFPTQTLAGRRIAVTL
jgi:hypothetical protein